MSYTAVQSHIVERRLQGRSFARESVQISNFIACKTCGAPKGFMCEGWERDRGSCGTRFTAWIQSEEYRKWIKVPRGYL